MAGLGNQSPSEGRFQTRHTYIHQSVIDGKGATGDKIYIPVVHDSIEILDFGWEISTAPGATTTASAARLDKIPANNGTRNNAISPDSVAAKSTLTFDSTKSIWAIQSKDLNIGAGTLAPVDYQSRPTAVKGDVLVFNLTVQGVGAGAQDLRPYVAWRERLT